MTDEILEDANSHSGGQRNTTPPASSTSAGNGSKGNAGTSNPTRGGSGFPVGAYFVIREKGTKNCITTALISDTEGLPMVLWPEDQTQGHGWTVCTLSPAYYSTH